MKKIFFTGVLLITALMSYLAPVCAKQEKASKEKTTTRKTHKTASKTETKAETKKSHQTTTETKSDETVNDDDGKDPKKPTHPHLPPSKPKPTP